jgi:hypothetical protein
VASESNFSEEWLALREPADHRARSARVTDILAHALPPGVKALDLAAGTGSNVRYLLPRLPRVQEWLLVDHDSRLLSVACKNSARAVETRVVDLARLDRIEWLFGGRNLVTASALLDLVAETWLRDMLTRCHEVGALVLLALTYDGRMECLPHDSDDELIRSLVNRHQMTDKGFGRALGPTAADRAATILGELGYIVARERSDWQLSRDDGELQARLITGWADAAMETAPVDADAITRWRERRLTHVKEGRSRILVGHEDLAGVTDGDDESSTHPRAMR